MKVLSAIRFLLAVLVSAVGAMSQEDRNPPVADPDGGIFTDPIEVSLYPAGSVLLEEAYILYDTNATGEWTIAGATLYEEPIKLTETTVLRAQTFYKPGLGSDKEQSSRIGTWTFIHNHAPSVALTQPAGGAILRSGTAYAVSASASDPDENAMTVLFQYQVGSATTWNPIGSALTAPPWSVSWTPSEVSAHKLRAVATDQHGGQAVSAEVSVAVTPPNYSPDVRLIKPASGSTWRLGQAITLEATAQDQDPQGGAITRVEFYSGASLLHTDTTSPYAYDWTPSATGPYTIQAKGFDNHAPAAMGASNSNDITVLPPNKKPTASLIANPAGPFNFPGATTLQATANDSDGSVAAVLFFREGQAAPLSRDTASPYAHSLTNLGSGNWSYFAKAVDNSGDTTVSNTVGVVVRANQPPVARNSKDTVILVRPANTVALNANGSSDPENGALTYLWTGSEGVTFSSTTSATPTATIANNGGSTITLTVTDPAGLKGTATVGVSLFERPAITSRLNDTATVGTAYLYTITATGHNPPTYLAPPVLPPGLGFPTLPGNNRISGTPAPGSGGQHAIALSAANNIATDTKTLSLYVKEAPKLTLDLLDSVIVQERGNCTLRVAATGFPAPTYLWERIPATGSPIALPGSGNQLRLDTASLALSGNYRVTVRNGVGAGVVSRTCRVDVKAMLKIATQPLSATYLVGRRATLQAKATGAGPIAYQWFRGSVPLAAQAATRDSLLVFDPVKLTDAGLFRARVTNPYSDTNRAGTYLWTDTARLTVVQPKVDRPKATPAAPMDYSSDSLVVTLTTDTPSTEIRYTTDGSTPTAATTSMFGPGGRIVLRKATTTIKAKAFKANHAESDLFTGTYTYTPPMVTAKPTARPVKANFQTSMLCTLSTSTANSPEIRYTLNGTNPKLGAFTKYAGPFPLTGTTTVIAYAVAPPGYTDSDTLMKTYTLDKVEYPAQPPQFTPPSTTFTDSLSVALSSKTDSAVLWYTLDGTSPAAGAAGTTRKEYVPGAPLLLRGTTQVRAQAVRPGFLPSEIITQKYTRIPGPITASPAPVGGNLLFDDSLLVKLSVNPAGTPIWYTTDDSLPLDNRGRPLGKALPYADEGIRLTSTYTITAMAVAPSDTVPSKVFRFSYTKRGGPANTPLVITANNAFTFKDSLKVSLSGSAGSEIRYTLDGTLPTASSPLYGGSFSVDTTATLQAVAFQSGFLPSRILVAGFTLVADTPKVSVGSGSYFSAVNVFLSSTSSKTPIKYTDDGTVPGPDNGKDYVRGQPIHIRQHTELKAVALSGGVPGPVREASYRIFSAKNTVLAPGETYLLEGGYSIANPFGEGSPVKVTQAAADSLHLPGFASVEFSLTLTAVTQGTGQEEFPSLILARASSESRGFYKVGEGGKIYYLSGAERIPISEPGTYFMGVDASPPVITYQGEDIDDSGFTNVRFLVEDNVHNLRYDWSRSDDPGIKGSQVQVFSGSVIPFHLKNASGATQALGIRLSVTDYRSLTSFPADGQTYFPLSQRLAGAEGPAIWRVGQKADAPHDLVGIPMDMDPPVTLADLGDARTGAVEAFIYNETTTKFDRLAQGDRLVPGQAYWLASRGPLKGFKRSKPFRLAAQGNRKFTVKLKNGWNQVANPHLEKLYWPFLRGQGELSSASLVKGLWAYAPEDSRIFLEADALEPWKGYYVYNFGGETTVELSSLPIARPVQKKESAAEVEAVLELGFGDAASVRLGASPSGLDAVGLDDEAALPALSARSRFKALRQGRGLSTDWIRLEQDRVLAWKVIAGHGGPHSQAEALPAVRMLSGRLPEGYEAWAVSRLRGMKFRLTPGEGLPASGLAADTLEILAGPAAKLAGHPRLHGLSEMAPELDVQVRHQPGGPEMRLDLPSASRVRAVLYDLRGRSLGELRTSLPAGRYRFPFSGFRLVGRTAPGVHFLRVDIRSGAQSASLTRKAIIRD